MVQTIRPMPHEASKQKAKALWQEGEVDEIQAVGTSDRMEV
jgi:hypothetical protein